MSAWMLFTMLVARLGAVETAAHHIATNILTLSDMPGYGISIATTALWHLRQRTSILLDNTQPRRCS